VNFINGKLPDTFLEFVKFLDFGQNGN